MSARRGIGSPEYEARKAAWVAKQMESAPPLSDEQKAIIRAALLPVIREKRKNQGRAA